MDCGSFWDSGSTLQQLVKRSADIISSRLSGIHHHLILILFMQIRTLRNLDIRLTGTHLKGPPRCKFFFSRRPPLLPPFLMQNLEQESRSMQPTSDLCRKLQLRAKQDSCVHVFSNEIRYLVLNAKHQQTHKHVQHAGSQSWPLINRSRIFS